MISQYESIPEGSSRSTTGSRNPLGNRMNALFGNISRHLSPYSSALSIGLIVLIIITVTQSINFQRLNYDTQHRFRDIRGNLENVQERLKMVEGKLDNLMSNETSNSAILSQVNQMRSELSNALSGVDTKLRANNDNVKSQLDQTKTDVKKMITDVHSELQTTKDSIGTQLTDTKNELEDAMSNAKSVIRIEVDSVKKNMDAYIAVTNQKLSTESDFIKYEIAGTFTLLACMICLWHVSGHLRHLGKPTIQRRILAILWMVPIYSVTSWLSLVFPSAENYLSTFRDCYEAYAVYTFMAWLITVLSDDNGKEVNAVTVLSQHVRVSSIKGGQRVSHVIRPPCPCGYDPNNRRSVAATILYQCQAMALQFVLLKPLLAALPLLLEQCGLRYYSVNIIYYDEGKEAYFNWFAPKLYVNFALNLSVAIAFYGLLNFYHATKDVLAWCDPWPKFLCIKGVVFMTFWQGFAINILSGANLVDENSARSAQDLIICIEMLIASIAHKFIFPYEEWQDGYKREKEQSIIFRDTLALKDFIEDIKGMIYKKAFEGVVHSHDEPFSDPEAEAADPSSNISVSSLDDEMHDFSNNPMSKRTMGSSGGSYTINQIISSPIGLVGSPSITTSSHGESKRSTSQHYQDEEKDEGDSHDGDYGDESGSIPTRINLNLEKLKSEIEVVVHDLAPEMNTEKKSR